MRTILLLLAFAVVLSCACDSKTKHAAKKNGGRKMIIVLTSSAFKEGAAIPKKYTCDGPDVSPPLAWHGIPEDAESLALIVDDPDAPMGIWVHWVIFNIPTEPGEMREGVPTEKTLSNGAIQGINSSHNIGYHGPCPPHGTHRYYFKLYALDTRLDLRPGVTKAELTEAMHGHVLAEGQLMGRYSKS